MNKNIKTCPNCDAYEVKGEYHSLFGCGSYYSDMRMGTPTITEKREGYRFHETLQLKNMLKNKQKFQNKH